MRQSKTNNKKDRKHFILYHGDKMNGKERNAFERELQKDPFLEEAVEGFSQLTPSGMQEDLDQLDKRLGKRIRTSSSGLFYRIAAAAAVIISISTVLVISLRDKEPAQLSDNIDRRKEAVVVEREQNVTSPDIKEHERPAPPAGPSVSKDKSPSVSVRDAAAPVSDENIVSEKKVEEVLKINDSGNLQPQGIVVAERALVAGRSEPASGKAVFREKKDQENVVVYTPPQPVTGPESFNEYLEKNLKNPAPVNQSVLYVVVRFLVKKDSTISGIRIVTSPGEAYSNEAVRLIRNGPLWQPAIKDNLPADDSVSVSIVFR